MYVANSKHIIKHVVTEKKPKEESGAPKELMSAEDQHIRTPHRGVVPPFL